MGINNGGCSLPIFKMLWGVLFSILIAPSSVNFEFSGFEKLTHSNKSVPSSEKVSISILKTFLP